MGNSTKEDTVQHVFICGAKGISNYGGYETFVDKLTEHNGSNVYLKYHIACKANGDGFMDESKLFGAISISHFEFTYNNAHCFKIHVPSIGSAQAIYYDIASLRYSIKYCITNNIKHPIFYILASRIGPFIGHYKKQIRNIGGKLMLNPDGHEFLRAKWSKPIQMYWKYSEKLMVKYADLVVCDSINIEKYINSEYDKFSPETTYIAYGADTLQSNLQDNDSKYVDWMREKGLTPFNYYLIVGRFVPENNFEIMLREFMKSHSKHDLAIITNVNDKFLEELEEKLRFRNDPRIKFVGTVYDSDLLKKIRENAYGYFHGHSVGGTNPSLLEALGATNLNLLLDVGFNREVGEYAALYWDKCDGNLASLIDKADQMPLKEILALGKEAKKRIQESYSWDGISHTYERLFLDKAQ